MSDAVDAHTLASAARDLMCVDSEVGAGLWPRAAALLTRQGLELALVDLWAVIAPGLERTSMRCQLLCLGTMLDNRELGGRVGVAWNVLSEACHHRVYELPPTAAELNVVLDTVWELADAGEQLRTRVGH